MMLSVRVLRVESTRHVLKPVFEAHHLLVP